MTLTVGSLCTGYGGLDLAVERHYGARTVWVSDVDRAACRLLEARFPGVPNLGDLTVLDWATVPPVDILTAGYPCQPFSAAGKRKGTKDARHLWPYIARAVDVLRPRTCVFENVQGHLTLGGVEVVESLVAMGYSVKWGLVRASDAGAPHRRARVFIVAETQDADRTACGERGQSAPGQAEGRGARADAGGRGGAPAPDADGGGFQVGQELDSGSLPHPAHGYPCGGHAYRCDDEAVNYGPYIAAVQRWESITGRPAPAPTRPDGRDGNHRLNPELPEWMMGLPAGWITDPDLGLSRREQLALAGNGVVPQQAELALSLIAPRKRDDMDAFVDSPLSRLNDAVVRCKACKGLGHLCLEHSACSPRNSLCLDVTSTHEG